MDADKGHPGLGPAGRREGAPAADALAVLTAVGADWDRPLHLHPQLLPDKVHRGQDGQKGVPLTAPGPTHFADAVQGPGGHLVAQPPGLHRQRGGLCGDGQKLPRADPRPAGPPEAAGPAGNFLSPAVHLPQGPLQVQGAAGIFVCGEQGRPHHHMVLRAVHVAEGQVHHPPENGNRVGGGPRKAQAEDAVHPLGVAVIAHIVAVYTPGLAGLPPMTDGALHLLVLEQILQRRFADQAFFSVQASLSSHSRSADSCSGVWNQCSPPSSTVSRAPCRRTYSSTVRRGVILSSLP